MGKENTVRHSAYKELAEVWLRKIGQFWEVRHPGTILLVLKDCYCHHCYWYCCKVLSLRESRRLSLGCKSRGVVDRTSLTSTLVRPQEQEAPASSNRLTRMSISDSQVQGRRSTRSATTSSSADEHWGCNDSTEKLLPKKRTREHLQRGSGSSRDDSVSTVIIYIYLSIYLFILPFSPL